MRVDKAPDARLLLIVENGFGVLTKPESYTIHKRGGMGMKSIKTEGRNGKVVFAACVRIGTADSDADSAAGEDTGAQDQAVGGAADSLVVITANGQIIRMSVAGIRECGRGASGAKGVDVAKNARVISASVIPPESP